MSLHSSKAALLKSVVVVQVRQLFVSIDQFCQCIADTLLRHWLQRMESASDSLYLVPYCHLFILSSLDFGSPWDEFGISALEMEYSIRQSRGLNFRFSTSFETSSSKERIHHLNYQFIDCLVHGLCEAVVLVEGFREVQENDIIPYIPLVLS